MGVYIPNMEMPINCDICTVSGEICNLWIEYEDGTKRRHPSCPLVEVSVPHGRLIDADALAMKWIFGQPEKREIQESPTIIEAEETRDTVRVVRCKDCKHRDPEDKKCDCGHDIQWQLPRQDGWFCADGERREVDDG